MGLGFNFYFFKHLELMKNRLSVSKNPEESYYSRYSQVIADIRESLFSAI